MITDLIFPRYDIAVKQKQTASAPRSAECIRGFGVNGKERFGMEEIMKRRKTGNLAVVVFAGALMFSALAGCGSGASLTVGSVEAAQAGGAADKIGAGTAESMTVSDCTEVADAAASDFDASSEIGVITREDGSGTRGAFIELFGIEQKDDSGEKFDYTTDMAAVTNSTSVMMTTVAGDLYTIGYLSLGSLNDTVKAVSIDGVEATADNIKSGAYKIARPFNIVEG